MNTYKPMLKTERLILRPPTLDDFEAFHSWGSNPENTRYMAWGPNDEEQTKAFLAGVRPGQDFAVVMKETNAVIGSCGIYPDDRKYAGELGWILHKDYWKQGYGTELCGELIRYGFEDLKLGRIQAPCAAVNYGSYRIMERNGMKREALQRKAFWARVDKKWIDEARYAILAEDYYAEILLPATISIYLVTERLVIRNPVPEDIDDWHRLLSDKSNMYYLPDIMTDTFEESRKNLEAAIADINNPDRTKYFFAVEDKQTGSFIGSIGYTVIDNMPVGKIVHAGYFILPEYHGYGYTTEALREVIRFAFEENGVYRIETGCISENRASERVMEKCGLVKEAERKACVWHDGKLKDRVEYRLLRDEYKPEVLK